jgi:hypothetical protein
MVVRVEEYLPELYLCNAGIVSYVLLYYAHKRTFRWHVYCSLFITYFSALCLLCIVPLDLALTITTRHSASTDYEQKPAVRTVLESCFWPPLIFGGLLLWVQEEFMQSGHFSCCSRIIDACYQVSFWSIVMGACGGLFYLILIGIEATESSSTAMQTLVVAGSNTYGLMIIVVLMGYGLVELPLSLWRLGSPEASLTKAKVRVAALHRAEAGLSMQLDATLSDVKKTSECLVLQLRSEDPQRKKLLLRQMEAVEMETPPKHKPNKRKAGTASVNKKTQQVDSNSLAALRRRLMLERSALELCEGRMAILQTLAFRAEDVVAASRWVKMKDGTKIQGGDKELRWSFPPSRAHQWRRVGSSKFERRGAGAGPPGGGLLPAVRPSREVFQEMFQLSVRRKMWEALCEGICFPPPWGLHEWDGSDMAPLLLWWWIEGDR